MMKNLHKIGPFRWILLFWISVVYIWGLRLGGVVREQISNDRIFLFTIFIALHFSLYFAFSFYGVSSKPSSHTRYRFIYYIIQGLLVLTVSFVTRNLTVTISLYLALIGEIVGSHFGIRVTTIMTLCSLLLFSFSIEFLYGWEYMRIILFFAIPLSLLIIGYAFLFMQQTRARTRAQTLLHELEVAHSQLTNYSLHIEELTRMAERQRMARELHDTLAQGLAGLILQLEAAKSHLVDQHNERALEIITQAMKRARSSLAGARCAIDNLRTEIANPVNLRQAAEEEIDHFTTATGIPCTSQLAPLATVPTFLSEDILRIIAEGLTNVARHAQAHHVWICITNDDKLLIEIRDDGIGFDPTIQQAGHYGLLGLRERTRLRGGQFSIRSEPGAGTSIHTYLPTEYGSAS